MPARRGIAGQAGNDGAVGAGNDGAVGAGNDGAAGAGKKRKARSIARRDYCWGKGFGN